MFSLSRSAAALALMLSLCSLSTGSAQTVEKPALDTDFLIKAVEGGHAIILHSQLAETRSNNDKVKAFAKKLVKDHKEMASSLDRYASEQKIAVVAGTDKNVRDQAEQLGKLNGLDFDRAYLKIVTAEHSKAIGMCESQQVLGKNANLKDFAKDALPKLREHLDESKALAGELKGSD